MSASSQHSVALHGGDFRLAPVSYWSTLHSKFVVNVPARDADCRNNGFIEDNSTFHIADVSTEQHHSELLSTSAHAQVAACCGDFRILSPRGFSTIYAMFPQEDANKDLSAAYRQEPDECKEGMNAQISLLAGVESDNAVQTCTEERDTEIRCSVRDAVHGGHTQFRAKAPLDADDDFRGLAASKDVHVSDSGAFMVRLKKPYNSIFGIQVAIQPGDGSPPVVESICDGVVQDWNDNNPSEQIKSGDYLLTVNGVADQKRMIDECQKSDILVLEFFRPSSSEVVGEPISSSVSLGRHNDLDTSYWYSAYSTSGSASSSSSSSAPIGMYSDLDMSESSSASLRSGMESQSTTASAQGNCNVQKKMTAKVSSGLGYVKEQVENRLPARAQVSVKAQKGLEYVKGRASAASGAMSAQISQTAQKGLKLAKAFGKNGGA